MKKPAIIIIHLILFALGIVTSLTKLLNFSRLELSIQYLGPIFAYFDYGMDVLLFAAVLFVEYGLYKAKKWAWNMTFILYGLYIIGRIGGLILGYFYFDQAMEMASILKYGEIRDVGITLQLYMIIGIIGTSVNLIISGILLWFHYKAKKYFTN